jgi:hypothetical protein
MEQNRNPVYARVMNHTATTTIAITTAAHTAGVTRFELPLRGESLAAWLNSVFIGSFEPI